MYAPVNMKTMKGKKKIINFWNDLNYHIKKFDKERKLIVIGNMNAKLENYR